MIGMSAQRFAQIQDRLGLSDDALGKRLFRTPTPAGRVAALRAGRVPVGVVVALAMISLDCEGAADAAGAPQAAMDLTTSHAAAFLT